MLLALLCMFIPAGERAGRRTLGGGPDYNKPGPVQACVAAVVVVVALFAAACGGSGETDAMVWCVAPGEVVDDDFKREYPDLYMTRAECDLWERAAEQAG